MIFTEMTILLCLICFSIYTKFNVPAKKGRKCFLERVPNDCVYPAGQKFHQTHSTLAAFPGEMCFFVRVLRWPPIMVRKQFFGQKRQMTAYTLWAKKNLSKSCTISKRNAFLHFTQNCKVAAQNGRKAPL